MSVKIPIWKNVHVQKQKVKKKILSCSTLNILMPSFVRSKPLDFSSSETLLILCVFLYTLVMQESKVRRFENPVL